MKASHPPDERASLPSFFDVFLAVAGRKSIGAEALARSLWLPDSGVLDPHLEKLVAEDLLRLEKGEYCRADSPRAARLFSTLAFALAYEYDYNAYLTDELVEFLRKTYYLDVFLASDLTPEGLSRQIIGRFLKDGLLLAFRYEPFMGRLVRNPFLDGICEFLQVRPVRRILGRRIRLDSVIGEKLMARHRKDFEQISRASRMLFPPGCPEPNYSPSQIQKIIRYDLVPENPDLFDPQVGERFQEAMQRMHQRVQERAPWDLELLREYHGILMRGSGFAGSLRTTAVQIHNNPYFKTASPRKIPGLLESLVKEYNLRSRAVSSLPEVLALAAFVYNEFIHIHPFEDGNSRTARVLLAHILRQHKTGFETIPKSFDVRFLQVTKGARKRDDRELLELLKEILLARINCEELQKAREL
ncbi:MAG: Fic family protein [Candidatus Xenobium sp.]|jgi:fido (protein-threonine AMPylation protein)|nr:Fic family protein [Burkholderiales bacterium]